MIRLLEKIRDLWRGVPFGAVRSSKWPQIRKDFLILHDRCEVCGRKGSFLKPLEVHHCLPYHISPKDELNFDNLITLCREHHFFIGHLNSWKSWNKDVVNDAKLWYYKITNRL